MIGYGKRLLLVDDDARERQETALVLEQAGFMVVLADEGLRALSKIQQRRFDAVVTEFHMPNFNGLELVARSQLLWPALPVIIFSKGEWDMSEIAMAQGAFGWIRKSSDPDILLSMLALAMKQTAERRSHLPMERVVA